MSEYCVVVSLTDDVTKWEPGTVLAVFPGDYAFNPGDVASFFVFKIETDTPIEELKAMRLKKVFPLAQFMSEGERIDLILQKANVDDRANKQGHSVKMEDLTKKPDLTKKHKLNKLELRDTTIIRPPMTVHIPTQEEKEKFG